MGVLYIARFTIRNDVRLSPNLKAVLCVYSI